MKDPIPGFGTAEQVARFLLHKAFHYIHQAGAYEVASDLFGERIMEIEPDPNWSVPALPSTLTEWMSQRDKVHDDILDPVTTGRMADAWHSSLRDAPASGRRIDRRRRLQSLIDIVGHVVNLTLCLESILNRHLFFLRETDQLTPDHYKIIDRAELMPKLLFCFKEEITSKRLHVSRIKQLVSFRNHAVHYRVDSPDSLTPSSEDLIEIWRELGNVLAQTTGEPTREHVQSCAEEYVSRWIAS